MKAALLLSLLLASPTLADFSDDQFPARSDILTRIVAAAAEQGRPLRSYRRKDHAWYLRSSEYVGALQAPFGTVHIAKLVFTETRKDSGAADYAFVLFMDRNLRYRARWNVGQEHGRLSTIGTRLLLDDAVLFDYAHFKPSDWVHIGTNTQPIPQWK